MPIRRRQFHLGKKAFAFQINEENEAIVYGETELNTETEACTLSLVFTCANVNTQLDLQGHSGRILDKYVARSAKFRHGEFTDQDARRYLLSRFRDLTREVNRQQTGDAKLTVLNNKAQEYEREQRRVQSINPVTQAEEA